jgi:hypothetical protein
MENSSWRASVGGRVRGDQVVQEYSEREMVYF